MKFLDIVDVNMALSEVPIAYQNMAVYPITGQAGKRLDFRVMTGDITSTERKGGKLFVSERQQQSVPCLQVENLAEEPVLVHIGAMFVGGGQNRQASESSLLKPGYSGLVSVRCVERHRWTSGGSFSHTGTSSSSVRYRQDQESVWSRTEESISTLNLQDQTHTGDHSVVIGHEGIGGYLREIMPKLGKVEDMTGILVTMPSDSKYAHYMEVFNNPRAMQQLLEELVRSYASEANELMVDTGGSGIIEPAKTSAPSQEFYREVMGVKQCSFSVNDPTTVGRRFSNFSRNTKTKSELHLEGVIHDGGIVHMIAENRLPFD